DAQAREGDLAAGEAADRRRQRDRQQLGLDAGTDVVAVAVEGTDVEVVVVGDGQRLRVEERGALDLAGYRQRRHVELQRFADRRGAGRGGIGVRFQRRRGSDQIEGAAEDVGGTGQVDPVEPGDGVGALQRQQGGVVDVDQARDHDIVLRAG